MFYLMTKGKINLVRLILDFIIVVFGAERNKHASPSYGMFLTKVFNKAQLPLAGERANDKRPTTIINAFQTMGLKPKAQDKEKEKENKEKKAIGTEVIMSNAKKSKSKLLMRGTRKKKKEDKEGKKFLSLILKEKRSKRRLLNLLEEYSSSKVDDEVSSVAVEPINVVDFVATLAALSARVERGIIIKKLALAKATPKKIPKGKDKKKLLLLLHKIPLPYL